MIIKQFQNLRPIRLWGKKITDLPYNKIRIYCVYKDVEFSQDACSHCNYKGDIINGLKHFAVDINGKQIREFSQVSKAIDLIGEKAVDMWKSLTKKDFEQVKITYLEQRCYNYFHLCNLLNIDWRPTPEMIAAVKDKSLSREFWPKFKSIEEEAKFWRAALDPRLEWKDVEKYWK